MSRLYKAQNNIKFGYLNTFISLILKFSLRTAFIYSIGVTYLGVNGLFTNVLSVLSLADLGISTALNYSLYKPVAENDIDTIKALMNVFKKAYIGIACVITLMGIMLLPFLHIIIKDPVGISYTELQIYYSIFLFNTVSTYFIAYKYSLVNADQKNYIQTNFHTATIIVTSIFQVIVLLIYKSFLLYLLSATLVELFQKFLVNAYINKKYPYLTSSSGRKLSKEELAPIKINIKALIYHKIGTVAVHQTDNILISSFINVTTVGIVSNYTLVITSITSFINIIFNSIISSLGNLIATENTDKQYEIFKVYRFVGFWLYGMFTISFALLLGPFITLWIGPEMLISSSVVYIILIDYYLKGHRIVVNNFKIAAGVFDQDKYIALTQAVVNLVLSIILVRYIGLIGIFIGTVVQGLVATLSRPFILYRDVFKKPGILYYKDSLLYLIVLALPYIVLAFIQNALFKDISIINFILFGMIDVIVINTFFILLLRKRDEFIYLKKIIKMKFLRRTYE